ncbi:50S ribosomal protein L25/general stress protein Ctc [Alkaliflexus imshenetskii]|uniref:50S ribosomal protein L25/general stress protein Ctc n=1 Tax=Alkaliflexus imshenetskii TaxID=286730 RepID=UPI00047E24BC|nr:50S ribosomal protein L25/general stress protein Ctc [Alkaliflexus imshenetskii]
MQNIEIKAAKRENLGKTATKELRNNGDVPSVLYGGDEVVHFFASERELNKLIFTPEVYIVKLNVDGKIYDAVIKDLQFHPVSDRLLHADFLQISEDKPVIIEIPVKMEGLAEGVKAGGKLQLEQRKLRVKAFAKDLPNELTVNISNLGLGKSIQVGSLSYPNLELLNAKNSVVVSVKLTRAARAAAQQKG